MLRLVSHLLLLWLLAALEAALPLAFGLTWLRPLLLVPLVLHYASRFLTVPGLFLSLLAGLVLEAADNLPVGLGAFGCVALFILGKLSLAGIRREGRAFDLALGAAGALAWNVMTGLAAWLFGPTSSGSVGRFSALVGSMLATALVAPVVLRVARQVERLERRDPGAGATLR